VQGFVNRRWPIRIDIGCKIRYLSSHVSKYIGY
jgi:hypothetical protein